MQMEINMKVNGKIIKNMVKEFFIFKMVISIQGILKVINIMDMEL